MSAVRTIVACLVAIAIHTVPARAMEDLPRAFADCAGQFSAMVEHAWLMQDPRSDHYAERRAAFLSLLDAVADSADPAVLGRRIEAKVAQASLLHQATFGTDLQRAEWAARRAEAQLATCGLLLLDS